MRHENVRLTSTGMQWSRTWFTSGPGIDVPTDNGFQYREPEEEKSFMKADEYDELIDDPTAFLYNKWLPRVSADISPMGTATSYRNNLALVKGGMAMLNYFNAFGPQVDLLRAESGTVSAIAGIFKAPFDILGDKLRGYMGLTMDMMIQPDKSIVYHVDSGDIFKTHHAIGHKFCLSGGITNTLLSYGTPDQIRTRCKKVIDEVARDGGYIMDASAIIQNDATIENMRILTDFTCEYGVYSAGSSVLLEVEAQNVPAAGTIFTPDYGMGNRINPANKAGLCIPWEEKRREIPWYAGLFCRL